ncbi:hypothetical protein ANN_12564 [Periplaneta americana]|uniref:PiggyBac transposable element-derived protein domain-containing protein n=1 Tax=Periplaneta americana TaxID=6978 RepID=A0ABQ8TJ29_PERAM|nr:hypothetical protein ANN_12564 [Periplaneta americana]
MVFENKVLRKIFGAKRDEVTGEWRKLHNIELHVLYSSPDIITNIKSRRLRWAGHVARMGESRNAHRVLVGRPEGKRPLGRPRRRWEDNIKMDLREVGYDDREWINLAQDRDQWRAYVRAVMNLRKIKKSFRQDVTRSVNSLHTLFTESVKHRSLPKAKKKIHSHSVHVKAMQISWHPISSQKHNRKWLDECDSDDDITEDGSVFSDDSDGDYVPPSQNKNDNDLEVTSDSSETSENASDNDVMDNGQFSDTSDCFLGRNGTVWSKTPAQRGRVASHNILRNAPGPARDVSRRANAGRRHWKDITIEELHAFIGIVIHAGMEKSWDVSVREMFLDPCSNPFYRASMSVGRFETIRRHLRFDDKRTRDERLKTDTLDAFSYVWKLFINNCKKSLIPEAFLTIDEQLVPFRGRCRFLQYIPKKPAKYGIKINWLCESHTGYAIDGIIYSGKPAGGPPQKNLATNIVLKLAETVYDSARNISMDNYFTSLSLAEQLL